MPDIGVDAAAEEEEDIEDMSILGGWSFRLLGTTERY